MWNILHKNIYYYYFSYLIGNFFFLNKLYQNTAKSYLWKSVVQTKVWDNTHFQRGLKYSGFTEAYSTPFPNLSTIPERKHKNTMKNSTRHWN